jgi:hypothetical protein
LDLSLCSPRQMAMIGRHSPIASLARNGGGFDATRPSFARSFNIAAAAWVPTSVPGSKKSIECAQDCFNSSLQVAVFGLCFCEVFLRFCAELWRATGSLNSN